MRVSKILAYSFGEVLITIAIIGVITAMTLPTISTKIQNAKNTANLKETYAILQQVLRISHHHGIITTYAFPDDKNATIKLFEDHFLPYMKVAKKCYGEDGCWSKDVKKLNGALGDIYQTDHGCGLGSVSFSFTNGSTVCMDDLYGSTVTNEFGVNSTNFVDLVFYIDVNGIDRKPNVYGKDIFIVIFNNNEQGRILPAGNDKTNEEVAQNCTPENTGIYCLSHIIRNNNFKIPIIK